MAHVFGLVVVDEPVRVSGAESVSHPLFQDLSISELVFFGFENLLWFEDIVLRNRRGGGWGWVVNVCAGRGECS